MLRFPLCYVLGCARYRILCFVCAACSHLICACGMVGGNRHVFCTVTKGLHVWGGISHAIIANFVLYNLVMSLQNTFYTLSCMCILLSDLCYVILH